MQLAPRHFSFAGALEGLLAARGDDRSAAEIFGLSGCAFRLTVGPRVDLGGWAGFPWAEELPAAVQRLGYPTELVFAEEGQPLFELARARAAALCAERGPAILFGVQLPAFGLAAAGDTPETLRISGLLDAQGGARTLPGRMLGAGTMPLVFALALGDRQPIDAQTALAAALAEALRLGTSPTVRPGHAGGLAAYDAWMAALASGHVDPAGHAFTSALGAEARGQAAAFLAGARLSGADLGPAADAYSRVAATLEELAVRFPFPPVRPLETPALEAAAALLGRAREEEARGLSALARALAQHRAGEVGDSYAVEPAAAGDLFGCIEDLPLGHLGPAAEVCRRHAEAALGKSRFALVVRERRSGAVVGHALYAPLGEAGVPIAAEGRAAFLFCPWIRAPLRGRGLGRLLVEGLCADAARRGFDGVLCEASTLPIFRHEEPLSALGFRELARRGEMRLAYRSLGRDHPIARWIDPPHAGAAGRAEVVIRHGYDCPLLLLLRRALGEVARERGLAVDEADAGPGEPAGVTVGGARAPDLPLAPDVLLAALAAHR